MALKIESPKKNETVSSVTVVASGAGGGTKHLVALLVSKDKPKKAALAGKSRKSKRGAWKFGFHDVPPGNYRLIVSDFLANPLTIKSVEFKRAKPKRPKKKAAPKASVPVAKAAESLESAAATPTFTAGPTCTSPVSGGSVPRDFTAAGNSSDTSVSGVMTDSLGNQQNQTGISGPDMSGDFSMTFSISGNLNNPYTLRVQDSNGSTQVPNITVTDPIPGPGGGV